MTKPAHPPGLLRHESAYTDVRHDHEQDSISTLFFGFEADIAHDLQCFPMLVRWKLDLCGIKLSLRQWRQFPESGRRQLLAIPCTDEREVLECHRFLIDLLEQHAGDQPRLIARDPHPPWKDADVVPHNIREKAYALGVTPPGVDQWRKLTVLQRFVLVKLTAGLGNRNFVPALLEFGLIEQHGETRTTTS